MVEWIELQKECQKLKKKKEAWNDGDHAYQKTLIKYKHKVDGLERQKGPWLQEHDIINQTMEKMIVQILQMKKMIAKEEFCRQKAKQEKEQAVIEVN